MASFDELIPVPSRSFDADPLRAATTAYLARYKGTTRIHTESDLRIYLAWCTERDLEPLTARRHQVELYVRWLQEIRRFRPSTVSRRLSVVAGFYRTCVIDGVLEHSPADHVRRPNVPPESPTLGLSHLQFEALLSAARESANPKDFALVAMLGLVGLRIFEVTGRDRTAMSCVCTSSMLFHARYQADTEPAEPARVLLAASRASCSWATAAWTSSS